MGAHSLSSPIGIGIQIEVQLCARLRVYDLCFQKSDVNKNSHTLETSSKMPYFEDTWPFD